MPVIAYRADLIRKNLGDAPLTARSLVEAWDMADYHLLTEVGTGAIEGSDRSVTVTVHDGPDWARWREYEEGLATARLYYAAVWPGIAAALGASVDLDVAALDLRSVMGRVYRPGSRRRSISRAGGAARSRWWIARDAAATRR